MTNKEVLRIRSASEDCVHEYRSGPNNVNFLHRWIKDDGSPHGDGSSEWTIARRDYIRNAVCGANYEAKAWFKARGITCEAISKELWGKKPGRKVRKGKGKVR